MRRASNLFRRSRLFELSEKESINGDSESRLDDIPEDEKPPLAEPSLKVKRVDYYWNWWSKEWKYKNMGSKVIAERRLPTLGDSDPWAGYCFVAVRTLPSGEDAGQSRKPWWKFVLKSPYLINGVQHVVREVPGVSWNADPLEIEPELIIGFLPQLQKYYFELSEKKPRTEEEKYTAAALDVLIGYVHKNYRKTLSRIDSLIRHGEITHELLYAIMVPRTVLVTKCPITNEPRALQLVSVNKTATPGGAITELILESIDTVDDPEGRPISRFGRVRNRMMLILWKGIVKINQLDAYPIQFHPKPGDLKRQLLTRGKKWAGLNGAHHRQYRGIAAQKINNKIVKYSLNCRVMVDRATFRRLNPNYAFPIPKENDHMALFDDSVPILSVGRRDQQVQDRELDDDDLLLTSPVVYGFSMVDKIWLEFSVERIEPITWNTEAFAKLVLPSGRKDILRTLIEAHTQDLGFDDFVHGKGQGLVINLFGTPGVGKTLSAEATSEHVQRPLYIVSAGELGTTAFELDAALERVFDIATSWKAIILIDEGDVFMEQRSLHDLDRNAMVSIILRHLEYYRGILFITTNRVKTIDEAFRSRTHVAFHFRDLDATAKASVWTSFLEKVGIKVDAGDGRITKEHLDLLCARQINGRQIKNAVRTASSLALGRNQKLEYCHFVETLDAMDDFAEVFNTHA